MGSFGKVNIQGLKKFQQELEKLQNPDALDAFLQSCARELAARLLAKAIKRTPVGDYPNGTGKKGGTLRRGWTSQKGSGSEGLKTRGATQFVDTLKVNHYGDTYVIEIVNPVEYASYVEFGHRTVNHKGWVKGHFMMTIAEQELETIAPKVLERKIKKYLEECLK